MSDHLKHEKSAEAYSQYYTPRVSFESYVAEQPQLPPVVHTNGTACGPGGNGAGNTGAGNPPASSSGNNDEAQANSDLLSAWTQRLQTLTVVTAFLASMDGQLFSLSALNTQIGLPTGTVPREATYSCLSGALILHICACILGYIASFALIRYRIIDAAAENDTKVEGTQSLGLGTLRQGHRRSPRVILEPVRPLRRFATFLQRPQSLEFLSVSRSSPSSPPPPLSLLTHCYYTTLCLSTVGFILALAGILAYVWSGLPVLVGIFSSVCLGIAVSAVVWALAM